MRRTRVKICGITNSDDAVTAVQLGADALGFNMFEGSARCILPSCAAELCESLPAFVASVGVFVNADAGEVSRILELAPFDMLQFHGDEPCDYCESFGVPYIKSLPARSRTEVESEAVRYPSATAILLDTASAAGFGGTGETFDWNLVPELPQPVILAGGLHADNVAAAIAQVRPYAVDVASGVEQAQDKRRKDPERLREFFAAVNGG